MESKMNYIKAWQSLPEFGLSLFVVKFMGHKKEELLGIAYNRLMRMDIATGDHIKTWRYNTMKVPSETFRTFRVGPPRCSCRSTVSRPDTRVTHSPLVHGRVFGVRKRRNARTYTTFVALRSSRRNGRTWMFPDIPRTAFRSLFDHFTRTEITSLCRKTKFIERIW